MSDTLHESHRWGERSCYGEMVPVCLDCRVDGFEDEPGAFTECPGPPPKKGQKPKREECGVTKDSWDNPGHTHHCLGGTHPNGMHFCEDCRLWFG